MKKKSLPNGASTKPTTGHDGHKDHKSGSSGDLGDLRVDLVMGACARPRSVVIELSGRTVPSSSSQSTRCARITCRSTATRRSHAEHRRAGGDGVVFEHAYSHAPQTLPAHASILSGQLPFEHGVRDNIGFTVKAGQWFLQRALARARLADRGVRLGVRPARRHRHRTRVSTPTTPSCRPPPASCRSARCSATGENTLAAAEKWLAQRDARKPFFLFSPPLRAAQALRAAGAVRSRTRPTTARSPTRTRSSAGCSIACARWTSTTARRSSSCPITAKGSAITANRSMACSSTPKRRTCR